MTTPGRVLSGLTARVSRLSLAAMLMMLQTCAPPDAVGSGSLELVVSQREVIVPAEAADSSADALAAVSSLAVTGPHTAALFDPTSGLVSVFDRSGDHVWTFGGKGEGPGEFRGWAELRATPDGHIIAWDEAAGRLTEFEPDGGIVRTTPAHTGAMIAGRDLTVLNDGDLALRVPSANPSEGAPHRRYAYRRLDRAHDERPPIEVPESGPWSGLYPVLALPFTPHLLSAPTRDGGLYLADSGRYVVYRTDPEGEVVDSLTRPAAPVDLMAEEHDNYQAFVDARLGEGAPQIPATKPILRDLWTAGDGTVVLTLHGLGMPAPNAQARSDVTGLPTIQWVEEQVLDFFGPAGAYLGRLELSPRVRVLDVRFPDLWVAHFDAFDRPSIEVWRLEQGPS